MERTLFGKGGSGIDGGELRGSGWGKEMGELSQGRESTGREGGVLILILIFVIIVQGGERPGGFCSDVTLVICTYLAINLIHCFYYRNIGAVEGFLA